ncbi:hypothetical protein CLIB1444_03S09494 [[Candida] jaroonii]|uniref:Uncharacterized protein n=1 Tax=[Candida] jaroonii TaxID=467808 RepID=A0ACA9Y5S7_9ASCO|nr:hypothetical protein CLIB1444_03S09494 [[Candida] jaroonii]
MQVIPNEGLNTIKLGSSFHEIINSFKDQDISIVYSAKSYMKTPIKVVIKSLKIDLVFINYKLCVIELTDIESMGGQYSYNGIELSDLNVKTIYNKIFGPTYPGKLINDKYILSYPGITFKIDSKEDLSTMLNESRDYTCQSIIIFNKQYPDFKSEEDLTTETFKIQIDLTYGMIKFCLNNNEYVAEIGKTNQQDLLNFLGPPSDYFNKFDSRLLIHENSNDHIFKFHNYFNLGIDLLYDLYSGIFKKIIVHTDLIESDQFGKWSKCNFEIFVNSESDQPFDPYGERITNNSHFNDIEPYVKNPPVLLNRLESEIGDLKVESLSEFNWGNSKIYCNDHVIWEIVGDCISCVTIY